MLANALFASGDVGGAETEVRKAIALQASPDEAYPLLARALVAQGKFKDVISETGTRTLDKPAARADLAASLAAAYLAQGDLEKANPLLDAALTDNPADVRALLMKGQLAGQRGDLPAARDFVKSALASSPDNADALLMSAQIELASGNAEAAQKVLQSAIDTHPGLLAPRFAMVSLAMKSGKRDIAKAQVGKMNEIAPADSRTLYADALLAYADNDNNRARQDIEKVLTMSPDHLPSLLLSGLVNYRLGAYAAAEDALRKVDARAPNDPSVVRALATLYLRTGRASQAVQTLEPALRQAPDDPTLLRMSGEAYLASGDAVRAEKAYDAPTRSTSRTSATRCGLRRFAWPPVIRHARSVISSRSRRATRRNTRPILRLFSSHLRRREFDKAMAAVDALEKKQPRAGARSVPPRHRLPREARSRKTRARASRQALKAQPNAYAPAYDLALIDMQEGAPASCARALRSAARQGPEERAAPARLGRMAGRLGRIARSRSRRRWTRPSPPIPFACAARLALITWLARSNDGKAAVAAAQAALAAIPNDAAAHGSARRRPDGCRRDESGGRNVQAPRGPAAAKCARAPASRRGAGGAQGLFRRRSMSERKALALKPDLPQASIALARTYLQSGRPDDAIAEARKLQKEQPDKAIGYALEGEILAAQKKWPEAADAFRKALSHEPQPLLATRTLCTAAGRRQDGRGDGDGEEMDERPSEGRDDAAVPGAAGSAAQGPAGRKGRIRAGAGDRSRQHRSRSTTSRGC